jgi:hypothetical protein
MVGMGMLLRLLGPTPALLKSFGIRSVGSKTEEILHSLHPNRDLESLARDGHEIGYPRLNAVVIRAFALIENGVSVLVPFSMPFPS